MKVKFYYNTTVRIPYSEVRGKDELYEIIRVIAQDYLGEGNYVGAIRENLAVMSYDVEFIHAEGIDVEIEI